MLSKDIKISPIVPFALYSSIIDERAERYDKMYEFSWSAHKVNKVCVSFAVEDCIDTHIRTLNEDQLDSILYMVGGFQAYLRYVLGGFQIFSLTKEEKAAQVQILSNQNAYTGGEHGFHALSNADKQIVKKFLNSIECFAGIKFYTSYPSDFNCDYKISICNIVNLQDNYGAIARADVVLEQNKVIKSSLLIDNSPSFISAMEKYKINSIGHELLHILGLGHPRYSSLEEQKKYRSLVSDDEGENSFLREECFNQLNGRGGEQAVKQFYKCMDHPTTLQPSDVRGLMFLTGRSTNTSEYCNNERDTFVSEYKNYLVQDELQECAIPYIC